MSGAWSRGGLSLRHTAAWAGLTAIADLSPPGLKYRLDQAADFLAAIVDQVLATQAPGAAVGWPGRILRLADATCLTKPGSCGTDWRIHAVFDLGRGGASHLALTDATGPKLWTAARRYPARSASGNRNYPRPRALQSFLAQSQSQSQSQGHGQGRADFLVRLGWNALHLSTRAGKVCDLIAWLQAQPSDQDPHEIALLAAVDNDPAALAIRVVVQRKTPEATEASRAAVRRAAAQRGKPADPRSPIAAEFMILATSLPALGYEAAEILAVYRLRWQRDCSAFLRHRLHPHPYPSPTWERGSRA